MKGGRLMFNFMLKSLLLLLASFVTLGIAEAQAAHSAVINWSFTQATSGDPATGFHVQRSLTTGGPYTVVGTISNLTTLTFTDTAVVAGTKYFYVITDFNTAGDSPFSTEVSGTIPFSPPTGAPTSVTITVH
jgi:endoglucanase